MHNLLAASILLKPDQANRPCTERNDMSEENRKWEFSEKKANARLIETAQQRDDLLAVCREWEKFIKATKIANTEFSLPEAIVLQKAVPMNEAAIKKCE